VQKYSKKTGAENLEKGIMEKSGELKAITCKYLLKKNSNTFFSAFV
jgi:hypothetical protein